MSRSLTARFHDGFPLIALLMFIGIDQ